MYKKMKKKAPFKAYITYIYLNFETMNINLPIRHLNSTLLLILFSAVLSFGQSNNVEVKNILVNTNSIFTLNAMPSTFFLQTPTGFVYTNTNGQTELTPSGNGTLLHVRANTLRTITYTPNNGFIGSDTFLIKYGTTPLNITIIKKYIFNVKSNFVFANEDYFYIVGGTSPTANTLDVLANDSSTNNVKTISAISLVNNGTASIVNNAIQFTPNANYYGVANLKYTVCNGSGICNNTNVNINVAHSPLPLNDTTNLTTTKNKAINFVIPQGFSLATNPNQGTVTSLGNAWIYTPNNGTYGNDQFLMTQTINGILYRHLVKAMILYTPDPNQYAIDDYAYTSVNSSSIAIPVLANDFGPVIVDIVTPPTDGSAAVSVSNGIVSFTPTTNFVGVSKFTYKVRRAYNASGPAISETANVNVLVSNRKPELTEYNLTTTSGTPVVLNYVVPISNFNFNIINAPANGTLNYYAGFSTQTINGQNVTGNNLTVYTPNAGATVDVFDLSYCVASDCKNVKVNVIITNTTNSGNTCVGNDCVWAGDANADGKVDMLDLLQLGYCMGESGANRPNATTAWGGQFAPNWGINNCTNLDSKYMDTDGNGTINANDTSSISLHYGNYHNLTPEATPFGSQLPLYFVPIGVPTPGDLLEFKIMLGNTNVPAIDVYGLKFSIGYDPNVAVPNSEFLYFHTNSWMAYNSPIIGMSKIPVAGTMDGAMTRTNNKSAAGMGEIGRFGIVIDDDVNGFRKGKTFNLEFNVKDAVIGSGLGMYEGLANSTITVPLTLKENEQNVISEEQMVMFPNPAREYVNFYANSGANISKITISNIIGKTMEVIQIDNQRGASISTSQLYTGTYMVTLETDKGTVTKKLIINK
jgi:hypothetical protein